MDSSHNGRRGGDEYAETAGRLEGAEIHQETAGTIGGSVGGSLTPAFRAGTLRGMADSLFDADGRAAMLARLECLRADSPRKWGVMSIEQMLAHCQQPLRVAVGDLALKRSLIGFLFGRMAKKKLLSPEPWKRSLPTAPEFKIASPRDFNTEKAALRGLIERVGLAGPAGLTKSPHPFFGPLSSEEWQALQWRHLDHHFTQFGR